MHKQLPKIIVECLVHSIGSVAYFVLFEAEHATFRLRDVRGCGVDEVVLGVELKHPIFQLIQIYYGHRAHRIALRGTLLKLFKPERVPESIPVILICAGIREVPQLDCFE